MKDNRSYYDDFSAWYERGRDEGYHAFLDRAQLNVIDPYIDNADVCEIGCGTGLLLKEVQPRAKRTLGIDLSRNMLAQAQQRDLSVVQATATQLPVPDASFDLVYTFKVLPHVEDIQTALLEVARILRPGGRAFLEFYNHRSLRGFIKRVKAPDSVSDQTNDTEVFTRYDSVSGAKKYLPPSLSFERAHGIRVITPAALFHRIPVVKSFVQWGEYCVQHTPLASMFGGFVILEVKRHD
ncbi:MAG: class I SAM-dependent methyltransferase [Bradymonadia bacterium]